MALAGPFFCATIYMHVMNKGTRGVRSPLDRLAEPAVAYAAR
jgi:hypothetical protein